VVHERDALEGRADEDVARMIRTHLEGIVAWARTRMTNGFLEALNGLFQAAKRKARGYRRLSTIRTIIFLIAGKLDFRTSTRMPHNPLEIQKSLRVSAHDDGERGTASDRLVVAGLLLHWRICRYERRHESDCFAAAPPNSHQPCRRRQRAPPSQTSTSPLTAPLPSSARARSATASTSASARAPARSPPWRVAQSVSIQPGASALMVDAVGRDGGDTLGEGDERGFGYGIRQSSSPRVRRPRSTPTLRTRPKPRAAMPGSSSRTSATAASRFSSSSSRQTVVAGGRQIFEGDECSPRGIVDQHVDGAECAFDGAGQRDARVAVAEIAGEDPRIGRRLA
jgi:hypothetical protein